MQIHRGLQCTKRSSKYEIATNDRHTEIHTAPLTLLLISLLLAPASEEAEMWGNKSQRVFGYKDSLLTVWKLFSRCYFADIVKLSWCDLPGFKYHLQRHQRLHAPCISECPKCNKTYGSKYECNVHKKDCYYICPFSAKCSKLFKYKYDYELEKHKRYHDNLLRRMV